MDQSNSELIRSTVMDTLKQRFRPEFLNRIDEFVTFKPLGMLLYVYEYSWIYDDVYEYNDMCVCITV